MRCDRICDTSQVAGQLGILPIQPVSINRCSCGVSDCFFIITYGGHYPEFIVCRDTRVILTSTDEGRVKPLTENHHADARVESIRLRRMMGGLTTDSFGEVRCVSTASCELHPRADHGAADGWVP